jgi:putative alpha-1,2-mannosidase
MIQSNDQVFKMIKFKLWASLHLLTGLCLLINVNLVCARNAHYFKYVDLFIGSLGNGNVFVGASCPFGMVKPSPNVNKPSNSGYFPDVSIPSLPFRRNM